MAVAEAASDIRLDVPDEPRALRDALRRAVLEGETWPEELADGAPGGFLWAAWGGQLEAAGMGSDAFSSAVRGYRRELWLWLMGERTWAQCAGGLAGRLRRRAART